MTDLIKTKRPPCDTLIAEVSNHAIRVNWDGVGPLSSWMVRNRLDGRDYLIQRRGAFYFAATSDQTAGPCSSPDKAVAQIVQAFARHPLERIPE